ncbi:MAG TPA: DinB family protein [Gemmatimonadaceae bacterium]|nr:DinB family protein [Gemmatimonadaceae bacterium]
MDQIQLLDELAEVAAENTARIAELARPLSEWQLHWRPPQGGWGIADVLEHLCISDDGYLARLRSTIPEGERPPVRADWSPRLAGRLLTNAMRAPRKLPAPKAFRPPAAARAGVLDAYLARAGELAALIERSRGVELRRIGVSSPVFALIRMNAGDVLSILTWHARRHLGQMDRVRAHAEFPAS